MSISQTDLAEHIRREYDDYLSRVDEWKLMGIDENSSYSNPECEVLVETQERLSKIKGLVELYEDTFHQPLDSDIKGRVETDQRKSREDIVVFLTF